jgi:cation diffusion facilitator family transporter
VASPTTLKIRHRAATAALLATVTLTAFKIFVGWLSGSAAVLSEGIHSFLDLVSTAISYFTVREAGKPADEDHPFGHGKIETLSSLFESILLVSAAGIMVYEGYDHLIHPAEFHYQGLAVGAIVFSMIVSYLMYRHNLSASIAVESGALEVNALHFFADVLASLGVLTGLVVIHFTGWLWMDAVMAFLVAAYILIVSAKRVKAAMLELTDTQLPEAEIIAIRSIIDSFEGRGAGKMIEAHDLRTRKSGATRHIDFHLVCCGKMSVDESHSVCDAIEERLAKVHSNASVTIHVEPCEPAKSGCHSWCPIFLKRGNS